MACSARDGTAGLVAEAAVVTVSHPAAAGCRSSCGSSGLPWLRSSHYFHCTLNPSLLLKIVDGLISEAQNAISADISWPRWSAQARTLEGKSGGPEGALLAVPSRLRGLQAWPLVAEKQQSVLLETG